MVWKCIKKLENLIFNISSCDIVHLQIFTSIGYVNNVNVFVLEVKVVRILAKSVYRESFNSPNLVIVFLLYTANNLKYNFRVRGREGGGAVVRDLTIVFFLICTACPFTRVYKFGNHWSVFVKTNMKCRMKKLTNYATRWKCKIEFFSIFFLKYFSMNRIYCILFREVWSNYMKFKESFHHES